METQQDLILKSLSFEIEGQDTFFWKIVLLMIVIISIFCTISIFGIIKMLGVEWLLTNNCLMLFFVVSTLVVGFITVLGICVSKNNTDNIQSMFHN